VVLVLSLCLSQPAGATIHNISIGNFFFTPSNITVSYGDTVQWTLVAGVHSTTSDFTSRKFWDSGVMGTAGMSYQIVITPLDGPGPFPYHCSVHPAMVDTIFVFTPYPNSNVNPNFGIGRDQNNASVAISELANGEVYSTFNEFMVPGANAPTQVGWSWSPTGGAIGTWTNGIKPPDPGFTEEWNPWITATIPPAGGYFMVSSQRNGPPWAPVANAIVANISPGGGAGFVPGAPFAFNVPGVTWVDFPVVEADDIALAPVPGETHLLWTEFTDATGGDADGNGNPYDDLGDVWTLWTTSTNTVGPGASPVYPGFAPLTPLFGPVPVYPNSPGSHRGALDVLDTPNPLLGPGAVYVAMRDLMAGVVLVDANPAPGLGAPWGALTGGAGPMAVAPGPPIPQIIAPGIDACNHVTIATQLHPVCPGAVFVAWDDMVTGDADIFFSASFDGGLTWSVATRINQDPAGNGLDQWAPHMRVDANTGEIIVTYYDRRNDPGNILTQVWASTSPDCGVTWVDAMVSLGGGFPPNSLTPGSLGQKFSDYLGTDFHLAQGPAFVWNDGRNFADQDIFFSGLKRADTDADGIPDDVDNCPTVFNPSQANGDGDPAGTACDCDDTNPNVYPGAPEIPNDGIDQDCDGVDAVLCYQDVDSDTFGDMLDPGTINLNGTCGPGFSANNFDCDDNNAGINPAAFDIPFDAIDQDCNGVDAVMCYVDLDLDTYGDILDPGTYSPVGVCNVGFVVNNTDCNDATAAINPGATDVCNGVDDNCNGVSDDPFPDPDADGWGSPCDNCPLNFNPLQEDTDIDGIGDSCDTGGCCVSPTGNVNNDALSAIDLSDLIYLVNYLFLGGPAPVCPGEANVNGDAACAIDLSDLIALVNYLFLGGAAPAACVPGC
jgi:plastocyanin